MLDLAMQLIELSWFYVQFFIDDMVNGSDQIFIFVSHNVFQNKNIPHIFQPVMLLIVWGIRSKAEKK